MDPISVLGLVASSIAVVQLADRVTGLLGKLQPLFEAPREVEQLMKDVLSLKALINNLSKAAKEMHDSCLLPLGKLETLNSFVNEAKDILEELDKLIALCTRPSEIRGSRLRVHRGTWTRKVGQVKRLRCCMTDLRLSVAIELSTLHM